jgi:hypothetical protein
MKADDFVLELIRGMPDDAAYRAWIELFISSLSLIDQNRDAFIDHLAATLRTGDATEVRRQIVSVKGPGFWRDDSPLGRKVRVLNAIATSFEEAREEPEQWLYGLVTAAELVAREGGDKELVELIVRSGLG